MTPDVEVWIQLKQRNRWIYSLRKKLTLNVICNKRVFAVEIHGSGVLELQPGCEIVQPEMTITAEAYKQSEGRYDFNPTLNLSSTAVEKSFALVNLTLDHSKQIDSVHAQLQNIRDQTQRAQYHHFGHYTMNFGMIMMILIVIGILIWKRQVLKDAYDTITTSTNYVSDGIWRQWISQKHRSMNSGANNPVRNRVDRGPDTIEPSNGSRGEHVQSGHKTYRDTL